MKSFIVQAAVLLVLCGNVVQGQNMTDAPTNATAAPTNATMTEPPTNATEAPTEATEPPTNATEAPTTAAPTNATEAPTTAAPTNATEAPTDMMTNYTNVTDPWSNYTDPPFDNATAPPTEDGTDPNMDGGDAAAATGTCGLGEVGNGVCFDQRLCCSNSGHCFATCEEGESSSTRLASSVLGAILMGAVSMAL